MDVVLPLGEPLPVILGRCDRLRGVGRELSPCKCAGRQCPWPRRLLGQEVLIATHRPLQLVAEVKPRYQDAVLRSHSFQKQQHTDQPDSYGLPMIHCCPNSYTNVLFEAAAERGIIQVQVETR